MTDAMEFGELRASGLLWLINASVFHPRGLGFALVYGDEDPDHERPTGWTLIGAGDGEPFMFPDSPEIHELFRAAEATLALARAEHAP